MTDRALLVTTVLSIIQVTTACDCERPGPATPQDRATWLAQLKSDRDSTIAKINFTGGVFDQLSWTQDSYIQPQMHPYDRYFYDPITQNYTVQRWLDDLTKRYGGIDSVLLWPTYTNIGIDDRNQFDFFRTMPGGLGGVKRVTEQLKAAGVRVLWPYNPWDTGTRREDKAKEWGADTDAKTFAELLQQTGGDGFNGDTMGWVGENFWAAAAAKGYPLAFEPEGGGSEEALNWSTMGWGYWAFNQHVPIVDWFKFLTRGRFLTNACDRWATNKTDNLQMAWFNGAGYESWENVWGTWNGITPRDGEAIRRVATMLRFLGKEARLLHSEGWEPHTTDTTQPDVYASRFPHDHQTQMGLLTVWTLVNRAGRRLGGTQLLVTPASKASTFYDCYRGVPLVPRTGVFIEYGGLNCYAGSGGTPVNSTDPQYTGLSTEQCEHKCASTPACTAFTVMASDTTKGCWLRSSVSLSSCQPWDVYTTWVRSPADAVALNFTIEAEEFGCVLEAPAMVVERDGGAHDDALAAFLERMATLAKAPLISFSKQWTYLPQVMDDIPATKRAASAPPGTVLVPQTSSYLYECKGIEIEGDDNHGVDVQFAWEDHPQRAHSKTLSVGPFYMDVTPVTNARYAEYLQATGYTPSDPSFWLRPWNGSATPPASVAQLPVTYVSLEEARRFCAWAGGRLPHTYEWQYAAQGTDGRLYPWGNDRDKQGALPTFQSGNTYAGPEAVGAHSPAGDSPFGLVDMVGNVWQYTDSFYDEHTRAVLLRGGSNYRPKGSNWYFPNQIELNTHNKYFLFSDSYERAGTIGFRCVVDA